MMPENLQNLAFIVAKNAENNADKIALHYSEGNSAVSRTYSQFYREVQAWAAYLQDNGVKDGDRVVAVSPKSANHYRMFYACWALGAIAVPMCESMTPPETEFIIGDCNPKIILADTAYLSKVKECSHDIPCIDWSTIPMGTSREITPLSNCADAVAALIYTSGSTGLPKGVMLTQKNLYRNAVDAFNVFQVTPKDRLISLLPYWHAYALTCEIICAVMGITPCVIPKDIRDFKKNLRNYRPTIILAVPRIVEGFKAVIDKAIGDLPEKKRKLVDKAIYNASRIFTAGPELNGGFLRYLTHYCFYSPLVFKKFRDALGGRVRAIVCGGAPLDLELQIFFKYVGIPLLQGYGLSEASPVISSNSYQKHQLGSCGPVFDWLKPENGGDYTFKDEEGNLGKNIRGQLLVKGACVMKGYWNHTDASAKTMEDGWLNTGDVGHIDSKGNLYIHGRKGNMIVLNGGEKFHPEHIEDTIKTSSMISEAMIIGDKCKSVYALVNVPEDIKKKYSSEELHKLLRDEISRTTTEADIMPLQKPKDVLVLPDFNIEDGTMTATLKIRRFKIKEIYRDQIEDFLTSNGEELATKRELGIASSKIIESIDEGDAIVGLGNVIKK